MANPKFKKTREPINQMGRTIRNIATIGDSVVELSQYFGLSFGQPSNIFMGNITSVPRGSLSCPDGNGTLVLTYAGVQPFLSWAAPGDTLGPAIAVDDGIFTLPSNNPDWALTIPVTSRWLSKVPRTDILASNPAQRYWRRPIAAFPYVADAFTFGRFNWLPPLGIGSNTSKDIGKRYHQAISSGADLIIDRSGGNDVVSGNMSIADSVAFREANWKQAVSEGITVIVMLLSARTSAVVSPAKNAIIVAANAAYRAAAKKMFGVYCVDCYTPTVDSVTGYAKAGMLSDGVHWLSGASYEAGVRVASILNIISPDDRVIRNVGAGAYYDAVNNPGGNLLQPNQGAFAGTGGTPGVGATVGTGIAAGINVSATAPCVVTCNKVAATDGGPEWQEYVISGASADGQYVKTFFGSAVLPAAGSRVGMSVEVEVEGEGCNGVYMDAPITAPLSYLWDAHQMDGIAQGIRSGSKFLLSHEPIIWPVGVTNITNRIFIQSKAGTTFKVRLRNADLRIVG